MFDPNAIASVNSGIFGLESSEEEASLIYLPVPWEVTTSYGVGTAGGPSAILEASRQVDLFDFNVLRPYEAGLFLLKESPAIQASNAVHQIMASEVIGCLETSAPIEAYQAELQKVNEACEKMNAFVYEKTSGFLDQGKIVGILGGDHSVPFGALKALGERQKFGILHIDAHFDLRQAYEGFTWSHASIMYNVLKNIEAVEKVVQVGIRDFCEQEFDLVRSYSSRIVAFFDEILSDFQFQGLSWIQIAEKIIQPLPQNVWISLDIDGLDPRYCPQTGTPVPGGLDFREVNALISRLVRSGRKIVGFDLSEVACAKWDANVGARLLYKLSGWTLASQGKAKLRSSFDPLNEIQK
jgi:agmatinase